MTNVPSDLRDEIPTFEDAPSGDRGPIDWSALTSVRTAKSALEVGTIVALAATVFFGLELYLRLSDTPTYVFPKPTAVVKTLFTDFGSLYAHDLGVTMQEFLAGLAIGASIGLVLAALITQKPFVEKVVAPYILIMVTTPMLALVPFLRLKLGFGALPLIIAVALASGPMVMINAATGFRRTDLAKIALARSYGANSLQIFTKVRFPLALPMIIVGLMVGSIFGLLTAVGAEMVGGKNGLGNQLSVYASLIKMAHFWAIILLLALMGVTIYVIFFWIGKKWASWQA